MPIPVERLEETQAALAERIVRFLASHPENAYNSIEIVDALGVFSDKRALVLVLAVSTPQQQAEFFQPYMAALERLAAEGRVKATMVGPMRYYAHVGESR